MIPTPDKDEFFKEDADELMEDEDLLDSICLEAE